MKRLRAAAALRRVAIAASVVATVAVSVSAMFFPLSPRVIDIARGEALFRQRCASCHALDRGVAPRYGPPLDEIGAQAVARIRGIGAEEYVLMSIVRPGAYRAAGAVGEMPETIAEGLSRDDLLSLTAFLCTQGGRYRVSEILRLGRGEEAAPASDGPKPPLSLASVERGRQLFLNELQCAHCHPLDAYPGSDLLAPSLRAIGHHERAYLRDAILHASRQITPGYAMWQVDRGGISWSGRRLPSVPGTVTLLGQDTIGGIEVHSFAEAELEPLEDGAYARELATSAMPDFDGAVTEGDLEALLDFLSTLK